LCVWDNDKDHITVYVSSTDPFHVRSTVARVLGIPEKTVRVIVPDTSDSLHGKMYYPSLIAAHAAIVSLLSKKTCKIVYSRFEEMLFSFKRHPAKIALATSCDKNGKLLGMKAEITLDCGAYRVCPRIEIERMMISLLDTYECEHVEIAAYTAMTNKVPCGPFSGLGEPQAAFALELHATLVAGHAQIDPYRWRKENAKQVFKSRQKASHESLLLLPVLDEVIRKSDFNRKHAAYEALFKRSKNVLSPNMFLRGIGLGFSFHGNGRPGMLELEESSHFLRLSIEKKKKLTIITSFVDFASTKETFFSHIASRVLGISLHDVCFEHVDTATSPYSGPEMCSRTVSILGKAIEQSCHVLAQRIAKGATDAAVTKKISLQSKFRKNKSPFDGDAYPSYATEGTVVEVEINPTTLQVYCRGIWIVMDAGEIVSQELAKLAVEQAAIQNLGYASTEILSFEIGRIEQKSLAEYKIPGIKDYPRIDVAFLQGEKRKKAAVPQGLGDQAVTCVAPAYVSAIVQALGRDFTSIPLTAEIIGV
jgi:CO/xanthine dehydrogenase Mo-binding subunit